MANLNPLPSDPQASSSLSPAISVNNISSLEDFRPPTLSTTTTNIKTGTPESYAYSPATAEVLARVSAQRARDYGEARSHILNSIVTSDRLPPLPPSQNGSRGPGRPKGSMTKNKAPPIPLPQSSSLSATGTPTNARKTGPSAGTSGGRGRGRPKGRRGKRKRDDSEEDNHDDEDDDGDNEDGRVASDGGEWGAGARRTVGGGAVDDGSDNDGGGVRLPLKTKSGRSVHRPSQFVPTLASPTNTAAGGARKKKRFRKNAENAVCKSCERGHSPANNAIVFCDGCGAAYHQYCHQPPIEKDVIDIPEKEWLCKECDKNSLAHIVLPGYQHFILGQNLSANEKRSLISALPHNQLVDLVLQISSAYPNIAMFPPTKPTTGNSLDMSTGHPIAGAETTSSVGNAPEGPEHIPENHYDGYETDPPAHYPKPGNGLARTLPPETEDMPWLLDDNFDVFQQINYQGHSTETNGSAPDFGMQATAATADASTTGEHLTSAN